MPDPSTDDLALSADALLDAMHDAVLVTDARLDEPGPAILYCNRAFTDQTGWLPEDVLGHSPRMLQAPGIDRSELARVRVALEAGRPVRFEVLNLHKDGSSYWVEIDVTPLHDAAGRLVRFLSVQREVSARRARQDAVRERLLHDERTGLLNRRGVQRVLDAVLARRQPAEPAVVLADVVGLRRVNTLFGREAGDAVVEATAQRLRAVVGSDGEVGRVESGEFVLVLPDGSLPSVVSVCERVRAASRPPVRVADRPVPAALTLGVTVARPTSTADSLLREADVALRTGKERGPGYYQLYDEALGTAVLRRLRLESELRAALSREELALHLQPVVHLDGGALHHAEALMRWTRGGAPVAGPAEFVPVAEEAGLIGPLGVWALHTACHAAAGWQQALPRVGVAVNLSPRQLADPELLGHVDEALDCGLPVDLVTLEITETAVMDDPQGSLATLQRLRRRGLHLALDDFGTGHSSLALLSRLPVDSVKVDRAFVQSLDADRGSRAVVRAVVALAGDLGLQVVAEGVETPEQCAAVLDLGCDLGQGWLFGRPVAGRAADRGRGVGLSSATPGPPASAPGARPPRRRRRAARSARR